MRAAVLPILVSRAGRAGPTEPALLTASPRSRPTACWTAIRRAPRGPSPPWSRLAVMSEAAVLLVDDDAPIRRMLERTLAAEGYDVAAAADGGAALAQVERSLPDVIVLDVAMPGLDGLAVTRRLRGKGLQRPDPAADRARRPPRARRRPRRRRRRLPRQAVRGRGADRPHPRAAAPQPAARRAARPRRPRARARDARGAPRRPDTQPHPPRGGAARAADAQRAQRRHRELALERVGARARRAPTSSTATSPTCGASSATRR